MGGQPSLYILMPHQCGAEAYGSPDWTQPHTGSFRYPTISWVAPLWGHYISTSLGCLVKCLSWFNIYFVFILFANSFVNYYLALLKYTENTKLLSNWFKITEQYSGKWLISYRSILLKILRSNQSVCWASPSSFAFALHNWNKYMYNLNK